MMRARIQAYIHTWRKQGYSDDIPDSVPDVLMSEQLAPSYKAIAVAILKNDHAMQGLGFTGTPTPWYGVLKRIELEAAGRITNKQLELPLKPGSQ